jgi:protein-S-isoprenylcysteine O-methyltransferase Ste14
VSARHDSVSPGRRASDWAGFVGHLAIAVVTVVRTPALSLFLLPPIIHMVVAAGSFLIRDSPVKKENDVFARAMAYAGAFGLFAFAQLAVSFKPEWLALTTNAGVGLLGVLLGLVGLSIEIWSIWHLRFAFATEPAARRLVVSGPYRYARHPIYAGAVLSNVGLLMTRPTLAVACAVAVWAVCIAFRMRYEEAILTSAFPEYASYRQQVGALGPRPSLAERAASGSAS